MTAIWIIIGIVAILGVALYLICSWLVQISVGAGREVAKPKKNKRKSGPETPRKRQIRESKEMGLAWKESRSFETVTIRSKDGLNLTGYYFPCQEAKRTVLMIHGWRGDWSDMWEFGPFLQEERCNMLFAQQRGHRPSEGDYIGFGVLERHDCMKWIEHLMRRDPDLPIYLLGCSQGGATVLMTAGFGLPAQVRGIVADCGFVSPAEQVSEKLKEWWHMPAWPFIPIGDKICRRRAKFSYWEYSTLEAMKTNMTPILFVHGKEDRFVSVNDTMRNYEACTTEKELLLVEGARHIQSYALGGDRYRQKMREMFARYDQQ